MRAIAALLLDSYRELHSRKLFWITLVISMMFVIGYGSIGFDPQGTSLFFGLTQIESEYVNSETPWARALYMGIFSDFVVSIWLGWIAIILALISTASIFPDLCAGGSIDLLLCRPIRRITIFAVKYFGSLLFVLLQVAVFCAGIFLCVGLRLGEWNWMIFAAVPIVVIFFSYIFSFCVLIGVATRSALAALLLALLFWFGLWTVETAEGTLLQFRTMANVEADYALDRAEGARERGDEEESDIALGEADDAREAEEMLGNWHEPIKWGLAILPKNNQTKGLISRWLKDPEGYSILAMMRGEMGEGMRPQGMRDEDVETGRRVEEEYDERPTLYVLGTSLAFEFVILALAAWIFVRRDY